MTSIDSLPQEILLLLLKYLGYEDKIELICCCQEWYNAWMKKFIRKLHFRQSSNVNYTSLLERTQALVARPIEQLFLSISDRHSSKDAICFLRGLNYSLQKLKCSFHRFLEISRSTSKLRVKHLIIESSDAMSAILPEQLDEAFSKVTGCQFLFIHFKPRNEAQTIPYFPSLRLLHLNNTTVHADITMKLSNYSRTLHHLSLLNCTISDVSMLGLVPRLELRGCHNIIDISSLNDNNYIAVELCYNIQDYFRSFANSREIEIILPRRRVQFDFDLTRWSKVEDLSMVALSSGTIIHHVYDNNRLPESVKRCHLERDFVFSTDFKVTPLHALQEITLLYDTSIKSLKLFGFENLERIELCSMGSLKSLEGLGNGKNRKLIISHCNQVKDFTPLNLIPIVEIHHCRGFSDLSQLRFVHSLTVTPSAYINDFSVDHESETYSNIHSLTLLHKLPCINHFEGLERIPHLCLNYRGFELLGIFLEEGKRLYNRRIVLVSGDRRSEVLLAKDLISLHDRFLKHDYYYCAKLPRRWMWIRNEEN